MRLTRSQPQQLRNIKGLSRSKRILIHKTKQEKLEKKHLKKLLRLAKQVFNICSKKPIYNFDIDFDLLGMNNTKSRYD